MQASDLRNYLAKEDFLGEAQQQKDLRLLKGNSTTPTVVVSSTLRRAVTTVAIALHDRLSERGEKIMWLPCCQEISRNPDTLCITPAEGPAKPAMTDVSYGFALKDPHKAVNMTKAYEKFMDLSQHTGNKPLGGTGGQRLHAFAEWSAALPLPPTPSAPPKHLCAPICSPCPCLIKSC